MSSISNSPSVVLPPPLFFAASGRPRTQHRYDILSLRDLSLAPLVGRKPVPCDSQCLLAQTDEQNHSYCTEQVISVNDPYASLSSIRRFRVSRSHYLCFAALCCNRSEYYSSCPLSEPARPPNRVTRLDWLAGEICFGLDITHAVLSCRCLRRCAFCLHPGLSPLRVQHTTTRRTLPVFCGGGQSVFADS